MITASDAIPAPSRDTLTMDDAARERWDVVVVGAGLAGCVAAHGLAKVGLRTLIVERQKLPRWKVCGGCLGSVGVDVLVQQGLSDALDRAGSPNVERVVVRSSDRSFDSPLRRMRAVSRETLDDALLTEAIDAGANVLTGTRAHVEPDGSGGYGVSIGTDRLPLRAEAVVVASGLIAGGDDEPGIARGAWVGAGVTVPRNEHDTIADDDATLTMYVGEGGYLGKVRLGDGSMNWAIAMAPRSSEKHGSRKSIGELAREVCASSGGDADEVPTTGWRGTPRLTQRHEARSGNLFRVGDAAGYVEPITGEGMSWAILTGARCVPSVTRFVKGNEDEDWSRSHAKLVRGRRLRCALVARSLRQPALVRAGLSLASAFPRTGAWALGWCIENTGGSA